MGVGLIDWIFENLDVQTLDKKQIVDYLKYLREISGQETSLKKIVKYNAYKVALESRLVYLDQELLNTWRIINLSEKEENKKAS